MMDKKDKIKVTMDFMAGSILLKAMNYYVENFEDATKDLRESADELGEDKNKAMVAFGLATGESLDGIRNQIRRKGHRIGWGSDEHRSTWCNEKESESDLPNSRYR